MIAIVNHDYIHEIPGRFLTDFMIREKDRPDVVLSDKLQIKFLEMNKFVAQYPWAADADCVPDMDMLKAMDKKSQWALLLVSPSREVREMLRQLNPQIDSAVERVSLLESSDNAWKEYLYRERMAHDHATLLFESEQRGEQRGEARGIRIGEERGIRIGEERGIRMGEERGIRMGEERGQFLKTVEFAKKMLARNKTIEEITEMTGLTWDQIQGMI